MHTQLELASADWIAIYRRLGAKAKRGIWRSSTPTGGMPCLCPMAAILAHAGVLPVWATADEFADLAAMTWPTDFREGFIEGFDDQQRTPRIRVDIADYEAGDELGRRAAKTLQQAGLL